MSEQNRLATVKNATDLLGVVSSLNPNKAITISELQAMAPVQIATCDVDNADMDYALSVNGGNLVLVNNLSEKEITINCGYGWLYLKDGMKGGWFVAEDSSGALSKIDFIAPTFNGSVYFHWMKRNGDFSYSLAGSNSLTLVIDEDNSMEINNVQSQVGNIYYLNITAD